MHWVAPSEKDTANGSLEKRLWDSGDQFRANSGLKAQEYSGPILGIIFLRFAEVRFAKHRATLELPSPSGRGAGGEGHEIQPSGGRFDFVLANPPFNVNAVDKERLKDSAGPGRRFPFGLPRTDNANYLWIQLFHSALNAKGRAGFVMANSASDARSSEQDIRQKLIESRAVDVMVAVGPNMFYTVTLPCTLWFFDKAKAGHPRPSDGRGAGGEGRADTVLFIDARHIYRQIDRAHRDWTPAQIGFLANIVRLYRGEVPDFTLGDDEAEAKLKEIFGSPSPTGRGSKGEGPQVGRGAKGEGTRALAYQDIAGLCRAAKLKEIEAQGWSLNPGRYVGVAPGEAVSDEDFKEQLETLNEELETLNVQARELEATIAKNVAEILEA
jgi:type I restriction enzyme M protein